jgi:hypothetical protein
MTEATGSNPNPFAEDFEAAVVPLPEAPIETGFCPSRRGFRDRPGPSITVLEKPRFPP